MLLPSTKDCKASKEFKSIGHAPIYLAIIATYINSLQNQYVSVHTGTLELLVVRHILYLFYLIMLKVSFIMCLLVVCHAKHFERCDLVRELRRQGFPEGDLRDCKYSL